MMGGPGSGGERANAGRKPKSPRERVLDGTATSAERELAINPPPIKRVPRPLDLTSGQRDIWDSLSPLASFERTLTNSTTPAFRDLCELIALRAEMSKQIALEGLTVETPLGQKAHPLLAQFRGLQQRIEAGMVRFRLAPFGKALFEDPAKAKQDRFDDLDEDEDDDDS
jgi:hypothetical protein